MIYYSYGLYSVPGNPMYTNREKGGRESEVDIEHMESVQHGGH